MAEQRQYHIQLKKGEVGRYVLLPGDPGRVEKIASREVVQRRRLEP